jgi:hypothetical protein
MSVLRITKPLTRGARARELQRLLAKAGARPGPIDGVFGPRTAAACAEAKFRLFGYRKKYCTPVAGAQLLAYLKGRRITPAMKARVVLRRERAQARVLRLKALDEARKDVGLVEGSGNRIKYNSWWGYALGAAYCIRAVTFWYVAAGSTGFRRGARWEGATALLQAALRGEHGLRVVANPLPGDVMLIDWSYPRLDPDHGGVVERVRDAEVDTIEGNTQIGGGREGVGRKTRPRRQCWFVRATK